MDPSLIEAAITKKTKAIIPVHLYGNPCKIDTILAIARKNNLFVVEDCAQAHLAKYRGQYLGTYGDIGTFSFYPGKNLGAYGDAGCIITQNKELALRFKKLRDHGRLSKYEHDIVGYNQRMDAIQAGVLNVKLKYLEKWTETRRKNASRYDFHLDSLGIKTVKAIDHSDPVHHLYVIELENRSQVMDHLKQNEISCGIHYPVPLHLQSAFAYLGYGVNGLPHTENAAQKVLSLPMCPELTQTQIDHVCEKIQKSI